MAISFVPTRQDVERYRSFRAAARELNHKIIKIIPREAYAEIGDSLGIRHNNTLVFDSEDMTSVLMDCCLFDWYKDGKNLVQWYAETHAAVPGSDQDYLLQAYQRAEYRILITKTAVRGAGLYCQDALHREELFLMDLAFSQSLEGETAILATRTIPLGEFSMTCGAALPVTSEQPILDVQARIGKGYCLPDEGPGGIGPIIARACLAAGAAEHIVYASSGAGLRKHRQEPRFPGFKRRGHGQAFRAHQGA